MVSDQQRSNKSIGKKVEEDVQEGVLLEKVRFVVVHDSSIGQLVKSNHVKSNHTAQFSILMSNSFITLRSHVT